MNKFLLSFCITLWGASASAQMSDAFWAAMEPCRDQSAPLESQLAACNAALRFNDPSEQALQERASIYMLMGRHEEALLDFNEAIVRTEQVKGGEAWAGSHSALWSRAVFYVDRGQVDLAMLDVQRVLTEGGPSSIESVQNDMIRLGQLTSEADGILDARTKTAIELCLRDQMCYENW